MDGVSEGEMVYVEGNVEKCGVSVGDSAEEFKNSSLVVCRRLRSHRYCH